jgi:hypothetical protein
VLLVVRRVRIIARRNRIRVAPPTVSTLHADFAASKGFDCPLCSLFSVGLAVVNAARAPSTCFLDGPAFRVPDNETIVPGHR